MPAEPGKSILPDHRRLYRRYVKSREPSSLSLFLLALIDSGLSTPYEFQRQAGMSLGASIPALRYLLSRNLVTKGKQGDRRRMEYSLTRDGRALLRKAPISTSAESSDLPSTLRSAILANYRGRRTQAVRLLEHYRDEMIANPEPQTRPNLQSPADMYRWMISAREHKQRKADLEAVTEIIRRFKQK